MTRKILVFISLFSLYLLPASAQEIVSGLQRNIKVYNKARIVQEMTKGIAAEDTLELPFFDDFSTTTVFPDKNKWSDDFAFINDTYSIDQVTVGIATLDAIDASGNLYEWASVDGFEADHLTSKPINLDYSTSDNIRLSFFYQAGGLGDLPQPKDSLILQFFAPEESEWHSVWKAEVPDTIIRFKPVSLRIDQPRFLKTGFMFRFVNYASLGQASDNSMLGNCDHWNLDYIVLDRNRLASDTSVADVAFRTRMRSVLKTHEAMPWKQFRQVYLQEMGSSIAVSYRNNDIITRNVTRNFSIRDVYRNLPVHSFSAGATNVPPYTTVDYNAALIYTFDTNNNDSARFLITSYIITDDFDPKENDTIRYVQEFSNYFSYDDGTAEGGYGINGQGSRNAMVALRFRSYYTDTIRAVKICFNDSYLNSNRRVFDLMIWADNNGVPGDVIYTAEAVTVEQGKDINGFYTYPLPDGVEVNGTFYAGWKQRSETFLNAGFDFNTPHNGRQFRWINGEWSVSETIIPGMVMIRPVMGDPLKTTSSDVIIPDAPPPALRIYPNPASDILNIDLPGGPPLNAVYISFLDIYGRELMKMPYSTPVDISFLGRGVYIVVAKSNGRIVGYTRLAKVR
ncbi:MAG: T9SS type A sorting domain-containing protein [Bacteroidales bacterium]|jgi:hypothetical protein|nr:T9SS type A sorting domain-containing protein [Bacteroidales bacterium]